MSRQVRRRGLVLALLLLFGLAAPAAAQPALPRDYAGLPSDLAALYFPLTRHNLAGGFLRYWWEQGQVGVFGYPISEEMTEQGRVVQYFERARFEYYPEHAGTPYLIQLGLLGRDLTSQRAEPAFRRVDPVGESPERAYIAATGHTIAGGFKTFWEQNNGLATFGYPISEEFEENGRVVQYFERARFEYHPQHAGTPYEVQLGHLGREIAQARALQFAAAGPLGAATAWTETLPLEAAQKQRSLSQQAALTAVATPIDPVQMIVQESELAVRRAPTTIAPRLRSTYARHILHVVGIAEGESIAGNDRWYHLTDGGYVPAAFVQPFTPPPPPRTWPGRWIDVNLSTFYATGYEGDQPLYSAIITAGRQNRTPTGIFAIHSRVENEKMDSATVGIPKGHPEYYLLENVKYTQYFAGEGLALHGNYWVHPSLFGRFSSNGCIGLQNPDAAWFWEFATFGTPVHIHF